MPRWKDRQAWRAVVPPFSFMEYGYFADLAEHGLVPKIRRLACGNAIETLDITGRRPGERHYSNETTMGQGVDGAGGRSRIT
jgi:hypothetical protein